MRNPDNYPSFRHLKAFETVAQLKSVSRASELINLSQPAVSHAISSLESRFEVTLFERRRNGSHLTPDGEILLARTQRLFTLLKHALRDLLTGGHRNEDLEVSSLIGRITPAHIRCLVAASANASFDDAARSIGISPPSFHRPARELENVFRRVLYSRSSRGLTTSKQGSDLARGIKLALKEIDYAIEEFNARKGNLSSEIVIGVLADLGSFVIARAINDFMRDYPAARIRIVEQPYQRLLNDLRSGDIDFLFGILRRPEWATDVKEQVLFQEPYVIVARTNHPLATAGNTSRDDLTAYDWLVSGPTTPRYLAFQKVFAHSKKKPTAQIESTSRGLIRALLTTSDRLTLLVRHEALLDQNLGVLGIVHANVPLPSGNYGITMRENWQATALQKHFLSTLVLHSKDAGVGDPQPRPERRGKSPLAAIMAVTD